MIVTAAYRRTELLPVPVADVWRTLAAFGDISSWAPNVSHSRLIDDATAGRGSTRRVQVGRISLLETVTEWEPPYRLAYRVEGLPPWLGRITNEWRLDAEADRTRVTIITTVRARGPLPTPLQAIVGRRLAVASEQLLAGLGTHHPHAGVKP
ncbi:SRPBCC family protein [Streptomyces sp. NPDC015492]|uniref:SRPBCC family protein n=1 Tax=Streptomyces sp. NPDC015492 TaxID=3364958 RepID=UPI0036F6E2C4